MKKGILATGLVLVCAAMTGEAGTAIGQTLPFYKSEKANNPLSALNFCADPTAVEYEGRVYVYGTNDHQEFDAYTTPYSESNSYGKINSLVCMSSADMANWTWHGTIDVKKVAPWTGCSWAPSITKKTDADGKTHFYLYFANGASGIGVLTADSPTGPWSDPLGKALVAPGDDENKYGLGGIVWLFDPGVCVDDNGVGWLSYGGGDKPNKVGNDLIDGNTRLVKLADDMIHFDGNPIVLPAPFHFEASEMNFIGGKYVYTYCANWGPKRELWSDFNYYDHSKAKPEAPYAAQMCYMVSSDPLNPESWEYVGSYLDHPGGNNHTHLQKFGKDYYLFHHSEMLSRAINNNDGKGYRSISANKITVDEENCRISTLSRTNIENGASQIRNNRPIATDLHPAAMMWNASGIEMKKVREGQAVSVAKQGGWTAVRNVVAKNEVHSIYAKLKGEGTLEIRLEDINSAPVGKINFSSPKAATNYIIDLDTPFKGTNTIYFVFTEATVGSTFLEWQLREDGANGIAAIADDNAVKTEYFNLAGQKTENPTTGIFIEKKTLSDGRIITVKKKF